MDPELPFYYHTSAHQRFYEGDMPHFSEVPPKQEKRSVHQEENLLELLGEGFLSRFEAVRADFHNKTFHHFRYL